ncbi:SGNH/GDSL hydrolase family protein [Aestuariivivens sediminis]|uniref:SGNH/GDSL hydrolase family protein n=1 Tax=Aestuariivivens sediminis TaxID=2913557 RepID=UPI001F584FA6|nr:GDSL-type esterase/lipase family protein [Aestuariivivens sediminis]
MSYHSIVLRVFLVSLPLFLWAQENPISFLALGDSYTAATSEKTENGWPYQMVDYLLKKDIPISEPIIIAGPGWTTTTLMAEVKRAPLKNTYGLIGLMIGVNNQFRGLSPEAFETDLLDLLDTALGLANGDSTKVFVVSIPDWGVTPFARFRDKNRITQEIAAFNQIIQSQAEKKHVLFIDVTKSSRNMLVQPGLIASDSLHPSARMHKIWGKIIGKKLLKQL